MLVSCHLGRSDSKTERPPASASSVGRLSSAVPQLSLTMAAAFIAPALSHFPDPNLTPEPFTEERQFRTAFVRTEAFITRF
jgi:hypothetical protein